MPGCGYLFYRNSVSVDGLVLSVAVSSDPGNAVLQLTDGTLLSFSLGRVSHTFILNILMC